MTAGRALLLVLDGAGFRTDERGNAVTARTLPTLFATMRDRGFAVLEAAGTAVGLEDGQVGNSEAGHLTIGAGEVVPATVRRLLLAWEDGSWQRDPAWQRLCAAPAVHVVGLLSDAGVHALARTMVHAATLAQRNGAREVLVHPVLDGVDSLAGTAPRLLDELRAAVAAIPDARIGVVQGRKHFCDRSGELAVSRVAADALCGRTPLPPFDADELARHVAGASEAAFPARLCAGGRAIASGEPVLLTSHRADRARQIATVLAETQPLWALVDLGKGVPVQHVFFPTVQRTRGLAHELRARGIASLRVAEKCKFPHVTHFLNGLDAGCEGEGCCLPTVADDEIARQPAMSTAQITDALVQAIADPQRRAIVANFANLDQVGHLGRLELAEQAAAAVDLAFRRLVEAAQRHDVSLLVTADHGNAEVMQGEDGSPFGSHTAEPVPFLTVPAPGVRLAWERREGSLANVAATFLDAMGEAPPDWMQPALLRFARR
ncbi:MAG: hypothetical protein AB7O97_17500 [Planctomycetota bacterium]